MKIKILSAGFFLSFIIMSLSLPKTFNTPDSISGTYGVSESYTALTLKLNEDHTFQYINTTNPKKPINATGSWQRDGNTISLKNYKSIYAISSKWKIDKKCQCLKSRKGLEFTRICLISKK